jgi:hypothetical protein
MPIYVYRCNVCMVECERLQPSFTAPPPTHCDQPMERIIAPTNWQIGEGKKGSPVGEAIKRVRAMKHA